MGFHTVDDVDSEEWDAFNPDNEIRYGERQNIQVADLKPIWTVCLVSGY